MFSVMKTTDKNHYDFGSRTIYPRNFNFSEDTRDFKKIENQQFIVPWQMNEPKKDEILV